MDHRNLYKTLRSKDIAQKLNKRRSLTQIERSEKRRKLFQVSRNVQCNQNEQKSESARSNIAYKKADYMLRFLAWKEEKLKRLENEKKTRVKPFVSAAFKSSFASKNHTFVRPKGLVNKEKISKHTSTKSKLKVDQTAVVKSVSLIQSNNKNQRNLKDMTSTKKANAIVKPNVSSKKPKLISPLTVEKALSSRKNKGTVQSENKNPKLVGNGVKFCNSEANKHVNRVNENHNKCAEKAVTVSKDRKVLECDETKKQLKKKVTTSKKNAREKPKLKAKSENLAITASCDHLLATPLESNQLSCDIFLQATSTQVKTKSSPEYSNILDFSISPLTITSSPKNIEIVKSTNKKKLNGDDVIKFRNSEPNTRVNHVNDNCIKSVKKADKSDVFNKTTDANKSGMFVTISKVNFFECDEMKKQLKKKVTKSKKNTSQHPSSISSNVLREAHEAYVRSRQKSTPSTRHASSSNNRQLTPSLTPNKRLLKRKSQVLSSKSSIKSKKKLKPELLLNTPPMSAYTLEKYSHTLMKSVLRTPGTVRIVEQQDRHKYDSTPLAVFENMDSDEQRSLHLRRRRVLYRPDSEIIIP